MLPALLAPCLALAPSLLLAVPAPVDDGALPAALRGVWERTDGDRTEFLSLEPRRLVRREGDDVSFSLTRHGPSGLWVYAFGKARPLAIRLDGDRLTLDGEVFQRSGRPASELELEPLTLPDDVQLAPGRVDAIRTELAERVERDQAVRRKLFSGEQVEFSRELAREMATIDRENTAWLRALLGEVGWIDAERFGPEAVGEAFLIVQHSGDLPLMLAARPHLARDLEAGRIDGSSYALLDDRLELNLGRPQRYGSQIHSSRGRDGSEVTVVAPLSDPDGVDGRRAAMGLEPLADYVARLGMDAVVLFEWPE